MPTDPIDDITVTRETECSAPVLKVNIPSTIPGGLDVAHTVKLHIEYTRVEKESRDGDLEVFVNQLEAGSLIELTLVKVVIENLPYMLLSWKIYVIRVRLEVLGVVSDQWSLYSQPLCVHCQECKLPSSTKFNIALSFHRTLTKLYISNTAY